MHKKQQILTEQNTSQMNKRQYTKLSSEGKQYLFKGQQTITKQPEPALSQKQNKFLEHFKSINNVDPINNLYSRPIHQNQDHEALYMTKLQSYAESKISQIERIMRLTDDQNSIKPVKNDFKLSPVLPLIHVKPEIKRNVQKINDFFNNEEPKLTIDEKKQQQELFHTQILEIATYSEILKSLPSKPKEQLKPQLPNFYSIYNTPTQRPIYEYQSPPIKMPFNNMSETQRYMHSNPDRFGPIQLNPTQKAPEMGNTTQPEIKFRKADMLLVEILRQKKRKGLVPDYFKIMELKLFELLDFILQDQPQFQGLSSIEKMKQVLKKLEYFKGKKIEGENKINLLKIFFQEFRNLKNQISQSEKKKPLQKVQNKPKPPVQKQQQPKEVKEIDKKGGQNGLKKLPYKDTVSINGDKKQKGPVSQTSKSIKGMEDQWMGDLQ